MIQGVEGESSMATRTYYGICTSESTDTQKRVKVSDTDIKSGFNFQEGDLLVVFFAHTNTESNPSIVVYNQDTNYEVSFTTDEGKLIKSIDIEAGMENAWAAGETVIFAYTQQSNSTTYYWELIDGNHASVETYGDTKLFDDNELNNLLAGIYDGDEDIALTPNTLKKFFDLLTVGKEEEEEDEQPLGLKWTPSETGEVQNLGILSLTNNTDGVTITYPIKSKITQMVDNLGLRNITHTGQLTNNGNGAAGKGGAIADAEPFITRDVPNNLYLETNKGIFYGNPEDLDDDNLLSVGIVLNNTADQLTITGTTGVVLSPFAEIRGNASVSGTITANNDIVIKDNKNNTVATMQLNGNIRGGAVYGGTVYENNVALKNKYSAYLDVQMKTLNNIVIEANSNPTSATNGHVYLDTTRSGWEELGVVGYNITYAGSNTQDAKYINLWEYNLVKSQHHICLGLYNTRNQKVKVKINVYILYRKII